MIGRLIIGLVAAGCIAVPVSGKEAGTTAKRSARQIEVISYELDPGRVYPVNCYLEHGVTTIMFPGPPEAIQAANVALRKVPQDRPAVDFLMDYQENDFYFSVRALKKGAKGSLNIVYEGRVYVLKLEENEDEAMSTVTFKQGRKNRPSESSPLAGVPPAVLKGLIDKAKAYDILKENYPADVAAVQFSDRKLTSRYDWGDAVVEKIWRFNDYDSLVFMVTLRNRSSQPLFYVPRETSVAIGERQYFAGVIDASGIMPPQSTTVMFFAFSGSPDGGKNYLDVTNNFKVLVFASPHRRTVAETGRNAG